MSVKKCLVVVVLAQICSLYGSAPKKASWDGTTTINLMNQLVASQDKSISTVISNIKTHVGDPAAQAASTVYNGITRKMKSSIYYNSKFLTSGWLGQFATLLQTGAPPYQKMNSFNSGSLPEVDRNYVNIHLVSALQSLNRATHTYVDNNSYVTNVTFTPGSFNGIVISGIYNNTQEEFGIYQQGSQIGVLVPGHNQVALYGASHEQGDIIFVPASPQKGKFRVSFKTGSDIVTIANSVLGSDQQFSTSYPPIDTSANFVCVQITANDFPANADSQTKQMLSRTQCINSSELTAPVLLELSIEDSITVLNDGKKQVISDATVPLFYPSIKSMTLANTVFPYLLLPSSLQSNPFVSSWISFINMIMGALSTSYTEVITPSALVKAMKDSAQKYYVLKKENNFFSEVSKGSKLLSSDKKPFTTDEGEPIQTMVSGLPGTYYAFTPDIPNLETFTTYVQMNTEKTAVVLPGTTTTVVATHVDMSHPETITALLSNTDHYNKLWNSLLSQYELKLESKVVADVVRFSITGSVKGASDLLHTLHSGGLVDLMVQSAKTVLFNVNIGKGQLLPLTFNTQDIMQSLSGLASGKQETFQPVSVWNSFTSHYKVKVQQKTETSVVPVANKKGISKMEVVSSGDYIAVSSDADSLIKAFTDSGVLFQLLTEQSSVDIAVGHTGTQTFDSLALLNCILFPYHRYLTPSGKLMIIDKRNIMLNTGQALKQLWISPVLNNNSFAEVNLPGQYLDIIGKNLQDGNWLVFSSSLKFNKSSKSYDVIIECTVNNNSEKLKPGAKANPSSLFTYTVESVQFSDGKKEVQLPAGSKVKSVNVSYQSADMSQLKIVSMPLATFSIGSSQGYITPIHKVASVVPHHSMTSSPSRDARKSLLPVTRKRALKKDLSIKQPIRYKTAPRANSRFLT